MNSLKTLLVIAALAAVAYGAYVHLNRNSETAAVTGDAPGWPGGGPAVQIPGSGGPNVQIPGSGGPPRQIPGTGTPNLQLPAPGAAKFTPPTIPPVPVAPLTEGGPYHRPSNGTGDAPGNPQSTLANRDNQLPPSNSEPDALGRTPNPLPGRSSQNRFSNRFSIFMQAIQNKLDRGQLSEAHLALTRLYDDPDLSAEQSQRVTDLLDQLAGTVIYSREHWLEGRPYVVRQNETLEQIARQYGIPWQVLAKINGIHDPQNLQPGQELKVVRGPFTAVIDLSNYELTMMLKGRYAGRFRIGVGIDRDNLAGSYIVRDKTVNPQYYGPNRMEIDADDPNNPLGELWVGLGDQIGIHGTNSQQNIGRTGGPGSICLGNQDIEDVFGILSIGSRVIIRR